MRPHRLGTLGRRDALVDLHQVVVVSRPIEAIHWVLV